MQINKFEDIQSWQLARELTVKIYKIFSQVQDYGFRDQMQRASVSIMNNLAEGFERDTDKNFTKFLYYAKGSAGEVRSMLYLAEEFNYIYENQFSGRYEICLNTSKLISGLIKSLKK